MMVSFVASSSNSIRFPVSDMSAAESLSKEFSLVASHRKRKAGSRGFQK